VPKVKLQTVVVNGVAGCFTDQGEGPVIVLLASPFARVGLYRPLIDALCRDFRVIAVEMPGCGCAARLRNSWRFDAYAEWVAAFLEKLDVRDVLLIGHSYTGAVAIVLGAGVCERVRGIVLADTVGASGPRSILAVLVGAAICVPLEIRFVLRGVPHLSYNLLRHSRNFLVQFWRAVRADVRDVAPRVRPPVLVAWGALDFIMPVSGAHMLAALIPHARLEISKRGSHDWLIDRAGEFARAVRAFAASLAGSDETKASQWTASGERVSSITSPSRRA
jgi:pimeloyl-ACP methyl ester carboxylesterase